MVAVLMKIRPAHIVVFQPSKRVVQRRSCGCGHSGPTPFAASCSHHPRPKAVKAMTWPYGLLSVVVCWLVMVAPVCSAVIGTGESESLCNRAIASFAWRCYVRSCRITQPIHIRIACADG